MEFLKRLKGLIRVGYFQAPAVKRVNPFRIPINTETIEVLTGGKVYFDVDGHKREFGKGTIFWHVSRDYTVHNTDPSEPYSCVVFHFKVDGRKRHIPRVTFWDDHKSLDSFTAEALKFFHDRNYDRKVLAGYLYNTLYWQGYRSTCQPAKADYPLAVRKAVEYIESNTRSSVSVLDVAAFAGVSKPYLFALFRQHFGMSPHKYLTDCRLNRARSQLAGSGKSIKEIAMECGFDNIECFYRSFKKSAGVTPAEYRIKYSPYPMKT
jgi:AraC-like DNA-binding protein